MADQIVSTRRLQTSSGLPGATAPDGAPDTTARAEDRSDVSTPERHWKPHRLSVVVLLIGLVVTGALGALSRIAYDNNEASLVRSQVKLTGETLQADPIFIQDHLGSAVALAATTPSPKRTFSHVLAGDVAMKGPFLTAELYRIVPGRPPRLVVHFGGSPLLSLSSLRARHLFAAAEKATPFATITVRNGPHVFRFAYAAAARGSAGRFVALAESPLPPNQRVHVPASSPLAPMYVALYLGRTTAPHALIERNVARLPIPGATQKTVVPWGDTVLTLVESAREALTGVFPETISWGIEGVGLLLTILVAVMAERLVRRRRGAELLAAENRRLFQDQRRIATSLQHSLLPQRLPSREDLDIAARYQPGTVGLDIGGDWYDVVEVSEHRVFFAIGDVCGRGLLAASLMASLRHAMSAYATDGAEPEEVLGKLGRLVDVGHDGRFATVLCGLLDGYSGEIRLANAGHLQPVLVGDDNSEILQAPVGPPIGVVPWRYQSARVPLRAGATLLAYTDGLVERRGEAVSAGIERLRLASANAPKSVEELVDGILGALIPSGADDDVAILGLRWNG